MPGPAPAQRIALHRVDERRLAELLAVAVADADPTEVMPPFDGAPGWHPASERAFLAFHRERAADPARRTYVVTVDGTVCGSIRLDRVDASSTVETGFWMAASVRGQGVGTRALTLVLAEAARLGASTVVADTTVDNLASQGALRRAGAILVTEGDVVHASFAV